MAQGTNVIPAMPRNELRPITIWIEPSRRQFCCRCSDDSDQSLRDNGGKRGQAREQGRKRSPWLVLHKLTHSNPMRAVSTWHPSIKRCHAAAKASKESDAVPPGREGERHVSMNHEKEYFTNTTEAYFGRNDRQTFPRDEFKEFYPERFEMNRRVWQLPEPAGWSRVKSLEARAPRR